MPALRIDAKLKIEETVIGALPSQGGTRSNCAIIGGQDTMPFLYADGKIPHPPVCALEFCDISPPDWGEILTSTLKDVWHDPVVWGNYLLETAKVPLLHIRLLGTHPEYGGKPIETVLEEFRRILQGVKAPFIVTGSSLQEIDQELLPRAAQLAAGEKLLIGSALPEDYASLTKACVQYGHNLITESPIDINLAKQVNILVEDAGLPSDRIVMYATTGALGYGLEYAYSIMEKSRLAGLEGDRYMNKPQIAFVGQEVWRAKEAQLSERAGINWETATALAYLHAGADVTVLRHPQSALAVKKATDDLVN